MSTSRSRLGRRLLAAISSGALAVGVLTTLASPAQAAAAAAPATTVGAGTSYVDDATFLWGVSGYAQVGVFGPWTFKDATGTTTFLNGTTSGGTQAEYAAAPVPATSMPVSNPQKTPNAVKFTAGTGTINDATGAGKLSWTGGYTVNAYPAGFGAPDEKYSDPELTVAADGSGTLTMHFVIGAGIGQDTVPFPEEDFGRLTIATFSAGSLSAKSATGFRITPDYQGVGVTIPAEQTQQVTTCAAGGANTGWWGSWPQPFLTALTANAGGKAVAPHFYSTGCGGKQDNKPQLPIDVTFHAKHPTVTVSNTRVDAAGSTVVTVTGTNFHPSLSTGTRPPLSGVASGSYVVFGKFAEVWRPSLGSTLAPSGNRKAATATNGGLKWAVPAANVAGIGGAAAGAIELSPTGSFTTDLTINKAALDATVGAGTEAFRYGIYTYPGSGGVAAAYETYTPLTFLPVASAVALDKAAYPAVPGTATSVAVTVTGANEPEKATGAVTLSVTPDGGSATVVDTENLTNGAAALELPADLAKGTAGSLTVSYAGDDIYSASTKDATYSVAENASTVALGSTSYAGTAGTAVPVGVAVTGEAGQPTPTGTVALTYQPTGGAATELAPVDLVGGEASLSLPGTVAVGSGSLTVSYAGDSLYAADTETATYSIAKKTSSVSISGPASAGYRTAASYTATVSGTGAVTVTGAGSSFNRPIVNGKATFSLPTSLTAGARTLKVTYAGDANTLGSSQTKSITIGKGATKVGVSTVRKATVKKAGRVSVVVTSVKGGPAPTGKFTVTFKKGSATRSVSAKSLANGKLAFDLPKLAKGTWVLKVSYVGSSQHGASSLTRNITVAAK